MSVGMNMNFRWLGMPYPEPTSEETMDAIQSYVRAKDQAESVAKERLAAHQEYLKQEEERRARQEEMRRQQEIIEAAQGAKEYADRQVAASMGLSELPQYTMGQAQMALYDQMAQQAQQNAKAQQREQIMARLKELEDARTKRISDPNFKMAAMLAMAGQPGAMQSLLTLDAQKQLNGSKTGKTQADMDQLEKSIMNDIFAISSTKDKNQRNKLIQMAQMLYAGQLQDMLDNNPGLVSRLGGVEGLKALLKGQIGNVNSAAAAAERKSQQKSALGFKG